MAQRYAWASPDRVARLTYPQIRTYLMREYEKPLPPGKSRPIMMSAEDLVEYERVQKEKQNVEWGSG
jgi:hypothetical protein